MDNLFGGIQAETVLPGNKSVNCGVNFLSELNESQYEAVTNIDGPTMIIAGAGSGKTRVLTYRLAFILDQGKADPFEMLALTFTNKAAKSMKERIQKLVGPEARNLWMGTFHSIFARILRVEAEKIGFTQNFTIYDEEDALSLVKKIIKEMGMDDKTYKPKVVFNHISGAKNSLVDPIEYATNYVNDSFSNVVAKVYERYNLKMFQSNAMDFDDLLVKPLDLFEADPSVLYKYQHRFRYIMIDEFQDTNKAQYTITQKLGGVHDNICVVGDDAQSIYSFRGANIKNILNFRKDYPDTRMYKLEQNYRSTKTIVAAANGVISKNKNQIQKNVFTENGEGERIRIIESGSDQEEAKFVTDYLRELKMRNNLFDKDFAILYRTNAQSRGLETELRRANIKYKIFGGLSFYKRKEIKDIVAYLKLSVNPKDEASLLRVINYPTRGIGDTTVDKILAWASDQKISFWDAIVAAPTSGLSGRAASAVQEFADQIKAYGMLAQSKTAYELASHVSKHTGILKELHQDKDVEMLARWENVQELLNATKEFSENDENDAHTIDAFLAEISLLTDADKETAANETDYVTLMTIHAAKGLEFPAVFVTGLEEELFPSFMSMSSRDDLEEERRLFYVAITRAEKHLTLSFAKSRYKYGTFSHTEPSRFLEEIDSKYLEWMNQPRHLEMKSPSRVTQNEIPASHRKLKPLTAATAVELPADFQGDDLSSLSIEMEVVHQKFGQGKVLVMEGNGAEKKATIFFQTKGQKVLLLKYARLKILN